MISLRHGSPLVWCLTSGWSAWSLSYCALSICSVKVVRHMESDFDCGKLGARWLDYGFSPRFLHLRVSDLRKKIFTAKIAEKSRGERGGFTSESGSDLCGSRAGRPRHIRTYVLVLQTLDVLHYG